MCIMCIYIYTHIHVVICTRTHTHVYMYIQHAAMGQLILVGTVVFGHLVGHFLLEPILVCDLTSPGSKNPRNTLLREEAGQKGSTHYFCHFWLSLGIVGPAQVAALYVCFV